MVDTTKAFVVDNGIVLDSVNGVGIYSDVGSPVGTTADVGSYYFNKTDGWMWYKYGALDSEWREVRPEYFQDHITLFTSNGSGQSFNKNVFERLSIAHINGSQQEPPNTEHLWQIICSQSGAASVDVRLYDVTNAAVLTGPINFTETASTYKEISFTPPVGDLVVEVQGMKNGNSVGELFWSGVEMRRIAL